MLLLLFFKKYKHEVREDSVVSVYSLTVLLG